MNKPRSMIKRFFFVLLILILILPEVSFSSAEFSEEFEFGTDGEKDAMPASVDILKVYISNNGTHFRFIIKCSAKPSPSSVRSYVVWLDTKDEEEMDYCLVAGGESGLYRISIDEDGEVSMTLVAPIEVEVHKKSIYLTANLDDIEYSAPTFKNQVDVVVTTHQPLTKLRDRAPDSGRYSVNYADIPEVPSFTLFIFIPSVLAAIYIINKYKFKQNKKMEE